MKYQLLKKSRFIMLILVLVCIALISVRLRPTMATQSDSEAQDTQQFYARIRDGLGELNFVGSNASASNVRASVDSFSSFMSTRSGVALSETVKTRLANLETSTLAGTSRRITPEELSGILADTALERIAQLSDADIEHTAEVLRGFDAPDLPESFRLGRDTVKLRGSSGGELSPVDFIQQVQKIRGSDAVSNKLFRGGAQNVAATEIQSRIKTLGEAMPEQFGSTKAGLTPMQAILITYSVVSDDQLCDSTANLQLRMHSIQMGITSYLGTPYASPDGHRAFGPNGYIFSTPLDLAFDEQTMNSLLNRISERSTRQ